MRRRFKSYVLSGLSGIILACGETAETPLQNSLTDALQETREGSEEVSATSSFPDIFTYRHTMPDGLSFVLPFPHPDTAGSGQPDAVVPDAEISPETNQEPEDERWVKVGNDHHQEWCPPEKPIYLAGKCITLEEVVCKDSDDTKVFFQKSVFSDFFEETIPNSDPSLGWGGTTTFSFSADPEIMESFPDVCKGPMVLIESYCSDGLPNGKGMKCQDYLPKSTCALNSVGEAYCQPEDVCLDLPGLQTSFPYDNDGDGWGESCAAVDICPFVEGLQTDFLYDTNGDGTADSCAPDFCPALAGVQEEFPYDNDNDGFAESCILDLCPENLLVGIQTEYPYDLDGDGVKDSCVPVDEDFCSEPDPQGKYPLATLYSYDSDWHIGFCLESEVDKVLHVICSADGTWHTDVTNCKYGMSCVNGACSQCHDTDGKGNMSVKGSVLLLELNGSITTKNDQCSNSNENEFIVDYTCEGNKLKSITEACLADEICLEEMINGEPTLACVPGFMPNCFDSDGTMNYPVKGDVAGMYKDGEEFNKNDGCTHNSSGDAIHDWACSKGGFPLISYSWCKIDEICVEEAAVIEGEAKTTLQCIPSPYQPTCNDSDGGKNFPQKGKVDGIDHHGNQYVKSDYCFSLGPGKGIVDYNCLGSVPVSSFYYCAGEETCNILSDPADPQSKTFACVKACIDTDPANESTVASTVFDFNNVPYPDICEGNFLYQYQCDPDTNEKIEAGVTDCSIEYTACEQGKCK